MNALLIAALALGQASPDATPTTALDGVWTVVAMEVNGRPATLSERDRSLPIRNSTLTLPGLAAMHGTIRLDLGPKGTLLAVPAAAGTGTRRDPNQGGTPDVVGAAGVFVRTADYLVLTIGDPSAATATGTGAPTESPRTGSTPTTVGQPPVSLVLKRATGADAAPSTAATPAAPAPPQGGPALQRASTVIGSNVTLQDGSSAGRVEDIVYSANGSMSHAVLGNNGMFTGVPWGALNWGAAGAATLPLTAEQFATIPTFGANAWANQLTNGDFTQRLTSTFSNFRDANGRPVFNTSGLGATARITSQADIAVGNAVGNRTGNTGVNQQPGNQTTNQPGNQGTNQPGNPNAARRGTQVVPQPGTQPGNQPGTQPGNPGNNQPGNPGSNQPGTQPGTPGNNQPGNQPVPKPGGEPGLRSGTPPANQPGPQPKAPPKAPPKGPPTGVR